MTTMKRPNKIIAFAILCVAMFAFTACSATRVVRMRPDIISSTEKETTESATKTTIETAPAAIPEKEILPTIPIQESPSTPPAPPTPPQATIFDERKFVSSEDFKKSKNAIWSQVLKLSADIDNLRKDSQETKRIVAKHDTLLSRMAYYAANNVFLPIRVGNFEGNSAKLTPAMEKQLDGILGKYKAIGEQRKKNGEVIVFDIVGLASLDGDKKSNLELSKKRATAVKNYFDKYLSRKENGFNIEIGNVDGMGGADYATIKRNNQSVMINPLVKKKKG